MHPIFSVAFSGVPSRSVWFCPIQLPPHQDPSLAPACARAAQARAMSMIRLASQLASAASPQLATELAALASAPCALDAQELGDPASSIWFRLVVAAPDGVSSSALDAMERALESIRAPLLALEAPDSILSFALTESQPAPAEWPSLASACEQLTRSFASMPSDLGPIDLFQLRATDGSSLLIATRPCADSEDRLADLKTLAKLAQASVEAAPSSPASPFHDHLASLLSGAPGSTPPTRSSLSMDRMGLFFPAPSALRLTTLEGFEPQALIAHGRDLLAPMARRFGALAASSSRWTPPDSLSLGAGELWPLMSLLTRLPLAPAQPAPSVEASPASRRAP